MAESEEELKSLLIKVKAAAAKSLLLSPTLCDPIDGSPPGSPVPGILQARTLEWVAISFSNAWKWKGKVKWVAISPPGDLPYQGIEPGSLTLQADSLPSESPGKPILLEPQVICLAIYETVREY